MGCDVKHLSLYDLTGIQPYVFGASALQENLGGSFLVSQALEQWLPEATEGTGAERRWSGGGNAMVMAADSEQAKQVATLLSKTLHERAPGLHVACAHAEWDETRAGFQETRRELEKKLNNYKAGRWPPAAFDGAGVTAACSSAGEPAVVWEDDRWQGATAQARMDHARQARDDIQAIFQLEHYTAANGRPQRLTWTRDIDRLGRSRGEQSMIGVIHFDRQRDRGALPKNIFLGGASRPIGRGQAGRQANAASGTRLGTREPPRNYRPQPRRVFTTPRKRRAQAGSTALFSRAPDRLWGRRHHAGLRRPNRPGSGRRAAARLAPSHR